ncbi:MAG: Flp pilus assembly protein CpaB [Actinomycetota bacterium]
MLALILATLATAGVFLYSQGVKEDARSGGDLVSVIVSQIDIPANSDLNQFIRDGQFTTLEVPAEAVIVDAVTELTELEGQRNSVFIFAGEQIPVGRVQGGEVPGGLLSIPEGHQAMTVALDAPRAISGTLAGGDNVTIYATFTGVEIVRLNKKLQVPAGTAAEQPPRFDTTVVLVPQVEVLRVIREATEIVAGQQTDVAASSNVQVVLALTPEEAQPLVYALEQGLVYLTLLPPGEEGVQLDPLTAARLLLPQPVRDEG